MSVSLDQVLIEEPSNFVATAFEVTVAAVDGLLLAKTGADVGVGMANTGVEKFIVRDTIPTMLGSLTKMSCESRRLMRCTRTKPLKSR